VKGAGVLHVTQQWTRMRELAPPKAGSRRVVPIPDSLVQMLLERKMAAPNKNGPVFASRVGGRLSHATSSGAASTLRPTTQASTRRSTTSGTTSVRGSRRNGLTARQIADAMGHRRTSTTERYVSRFNGSQSDERVRAAMSS